MEGAEAFLSVAESDQNRGQRPRSELANSVKNLEQYAEAAGLAQEGHVELAQDLARRMVLEHPKVLVVGAKEGLSSALVDYAIGFAGRMGYEIVALRCGSPEGRGWGGKTPPPSGGLTWFVEPHPRVSVAGT